MAEITTPEATNVLQTALPASKARPVSLKRDAVWTAVDTLVSSGLAFLFRLLTARFVAPTEFGVFALALTTFAIVQVINEFGMAATVIQKPQGSFTREVVDTAYAASTMIAVGLFVVNLAIIAPLAAWIYGSDRVGLVTAVIGVSFLFTPTVSIGRALLFRARDYRAVTIARIASTLLSLLVAGVVLALYRNVWALVVQIASAQVFLAVAMRRLGEWRPQFRLSRAAFREMIGYSGLVFANDAFAAVSKNLDVIVLGRMLTQNQVGLYSLAFYITDVVRMNLASILNRVMFTQYSSLQGDHTAVRFYIVRTMSWNALLIFPVMTVTILVGPKVLPLALGPAWADMSATLQLLALSVIIVTTGGTASSVFKAIGRPGTELMIALCTGVLILIPLLIIGVSIAGLEGAAIAISIKSIVAVAVRQFLLDRMIGSTSFQAMMAIAGALLAQLPLIVTWLAISSLVTAPVIIKIALVLSAQALVYAATLLFVRRVGGPLWPAFPR